MRKFKNTLQKGSVRYVVFREDDCWYAAALEFNIVESGDDPREVLNLLFEAIAGYLESARKIKARPFILNQVIDKEYESLWNGNQLFQNALESKKTPQVYTRGEVALATV